MKSKAKKMVREGELQKAIQYVEKHNPGLCSDLCEECKQKDDEDYENYFERLWNGINSVSMRFLNKIDTELSE